MKARPTLNILGPALLLTILAYVFVMPGCNPSAPPGAGPGAGGAAAVPELDPCKTPVQVLATSVFEREKGKPEQATLPFQIGPEAAASGPASVPVCVMVTSLRPKPKVLASGIFAIDGTPLLSPSAFNQNTPTVTAMQRVSAGAHTLTADLRSEPGASVRVYVLLGGVAPLPDDVVSSTVVVLPDQETTLSVAGATLTFPAGAVDASMPVTGIEVVEPYGLSNRIELLPDGLHFNKPVAIAMHYDPLRMPPTVTEAELLAKDAIQVQHAGEWRLTTVTASSHLATATLDHFSGAQVASKDPLQHPYYGGLLTEDRDHQLFILSIPLKTAGFYADLQYTYITTNIDPNTDKPIDSDSQGRKPFELKQVIDHIKDVHGNKYGINTSQWDPISTSLCKDSPDYGINDTGGNVGLGRPIWTTFSSAYPEADYVSRTTCLGSPIGPIIDKKTCGSTQTNLCVEDAEYDGIYDCDDEYSILVKTTSGGIVARAVPKTALREAKLEVDEAGTDERAFLIGSNSSLIKNGNGLCQEPNSDRQSVLALSADKLFLLSTTGTSASNSVCSVLQNLGVRDAILLDGGKSAGMVHNENIMNPLSESWWLCTDGTKFNPARRVINAISITHSFDQQPAIAASSYTGVGMLPTVKVTLGSTSDQGPIKVQCGSAGSNLDSPPFDSGWQSPGAIIPLPMVWSSAGTKTIYCTTFNTAGKALATAQKDIQVAKVTSIAPVPAPAYFNQRTIFVITGENLPDSTVAFIPFCAGDDPSTPTLTTYPIDAQHRKFACKPGALGTQTAEVKHAKGGDRLTNGVPITIVP